MTENYYQASLDYHRKEPAGKLATVATKPLANQRDLSLAYSPGVAEPCRVIEADPVEAATLTARGNLVAVITNGTAVLGLGDIGPLASKPVMEGKAVLFKKFAGVDVFDIELDEKDPHKLVEIIRALEPTFGGINLEDIAAPACFIVESELKKVLNIPVFHDDQHGTAIIVAAAIRNALALCGKQISEVKLAGAGAGSAALACLNLLVSMGLKKANITIADHVGVVFEGRTEEMDPYKARFAQKTDKRELSQLLEGADIFLGLSAGGILSAEAIDTMAEKPIVLALANPVPEILPEEVKSVRPDAIVATGRSDYPNQVNNVLCFPYLFRGALDVGATEINETMKIAAVDAIADIAKRPPTEEVQIAYGGVNMLFGPENIIPKPFDPRLISSIAPAIAKAAIDTGVATRPIEDFDAYREKMEQFVYRSGSLMKPILDQAIRDPKRIVFCEGERRRVLQAVQQVVGLKLAFPVLIGRHQMIRRQIKKLGLTIKPDEDFEIINPMDNAYFQVCWKTYHSLMGRKGVSPATAKHVMTTNPTALGSVLLHLSYAEGMLTGTVGKFSKHLATVQNVIGTRNDISLLSSMMLLFLPSGTFFLADAHVALEPNAKELAEITLQAANEIKQFGVEPKVALVSRSSFGNHPQARSAQLMQEAVAMVREQAPDLEVDGDMHADAALSEKIRKGTFPESVLKGQANTLIMPNGDAGHIAYNLLKMLGGGVSVGPILIGARLPVHILTNSATVRGIVNMTAVAVAGAQAYERELDEEMAAS